MLLRAIDLLNSLYVLFSQYRSCDNTLENCFFQFSSYSRACVCIIYEKKKGQVPLGPLLGKPVCGETKHTRCVLHVGSCINRVH